MTNQIGEHTISTAKQMLSDLLDSYLGQINRAYLAQEELTVNLSLNFAPGGKGQTRVKYGIAFIESKVKDGDSIMVDEQQSALPFEVAP